MDRAYQTRVVFWPKPGLRERREAFNITQLKNHISLRISVKWNITHLLQSPFNIVLTFRNVECQDFARVYHQRHDAGCNQHSNKQRCNWVESCPPIKVDQERRYYHTYRTKSILTQRVNL